MKQKKLPAVTGSSITKTDKLFFIIPLSKLDKIRAVFRKMLITKNN